jgi:hypothetical protein
MNKNEDKYRKQGKIKKILKILQRKLEIKFEIVYIVT